MAYFKIDINSDTGKKLASLLKEEEVICKECKEFVKSVGGECSVHSSYMLAGISGVKFKDEPDRKEWKIIDKSRKFYAPKVKSKFYKDFSKIKTIPRDSIDKAMGNNSFLNSCGLKTSTNKDFYAIDINLKTQFGEVIKLNSDCVEILSTEYNLLTQPPKD